MIMGSLSRTGHKMVTTEKKLSTMVSLNALRIMFYVLISPYNATKKGLTNFIARKPLIYMVGGAGFEPATSTV